MMTDTTPEPASDARSRLLDAAEEVFAEKGFKAASVREICSRADVNIASINYYFGGTGAKERLYIEAVRKSHVCSTAGEPFPEWPADTRPEQKLRDFIRVMVGRMFAPARPVSMQLMMREMAHPTGAAKEVIREFIQPIAFRLRAILKELLPDQPDAAMLMTAFSVMGQILFYRQNRRVAELIFGSEHMDRLTLDGVTDHITRFTLAALGAGGAP